MRNIKDFTRYTGINGDDLLLFCTRHGMDGSIKFSDLVAIIASLIGADVMRFTIEISINPADVSRVKSVECMGDVIKTEVSQARDKYTFTVAAEGSATIRIIPKDGYRLKQLNIDTVSQDTAENYTFEKVSRHHTGYIWMEEIQVENPVDFLMRSDKPDLRYSSTHVVLKSIKADYPGGLTQDVIVSCVKLSRERRKADDPNKLQSERVFLALLKDWNRGGLYTLTLDGCDMLTCDCASLGGLQLSGVDNVIIRNTKFINFCNYVDAYTPDEVSALMFIGGDTLSARNFIVEKCSFNGISTKDQKTSATYTISTKYSENVSIVDSLFANNAGLTFRMNNSRMTAFVRNTISGNYKFGAVGHAGFFDISNGYRLVVEDNTIDGTSFYESLMYISNMDDIIIRRNSFRGGARVAEMSGNASIRRVAIESNLFVQVLDRPIYPWIHECFGAAADITEFTLRNNTFWMSGSDYMQFVVRMPQNGVERAYVYNNIIVDPAGSVTSSAINFLLFGTLKELHSSSNLFQMSIKDQQTMQLMGAVVEVPNTLESVDSITLRAANARSLSYMQEQGYDIGSAAVAKTDKLLSDTDYSILPTIDRLYAADNANQSEFDLGYKQRSTQRNSRGCFNLHGVTVDEAGDTTTGYMGDDISEHLAFNNTTEYSTPADSHLLLTHKSLNRNRAVRWELTSTQHRQLLLGRYATICVTAELTESGEYKADQSYIIQID